MGVVQLWVVKNAPGPTLGVLEGKSESGPVLASKKWTWSSFGKQKADPVHFWLEKTGPGPFLAGRNGPGPVSAWADQSWRRKVARPVHLWRAKSGPDPLFVRKNWTGGPLFALSEFFVTVPN